MRPVFLYALCEPGTRRIRYIGKSVAPRKRLRSHLKFTSIKAKTHLGNWLRLLALRGEAPNMVVLREVPEAEGSAAEIKYIRIARESLGMLLVNSTEGGDGIRMTPEIRGKIGDSNRGNPKPPFTEQHREAIGESQRGRIQSPEWIEKRMATMRLRGHPMLGKRHTAESVEKMRRAHLGEKQSPETCEKKRVSQRLRRFREANSC